MVSIVLHSTTGHQIQINTTQIMYSVPSSEGRNATTVYLNNQSFSADVTETPEEISRIINAAERHVFSPNFEAEKNEAKNRLRDHLRQKYAPSTPE